MSCALPHGDTVPTPSGYWFQYDVGQDKIRELIECVYQLNASIKGYPSHNHTTSFAEWLLTNGEERRQVAQPEQIGIARVGSGRCVTR
jgi:hypothetical protein